MKLELGERLGLWEVVLDAYYEAPNPLSFRVRDRLSREVLQPYLLADEGLSRALSVEILEKKHEA
jgi:hypothetical protein